MTEYKLVPVEPTAEMLAAMELNGKFDFWKQQFRLFIPGTNMFLGKTWNPLAGDAQCARMENKCGLLVNCVADMSYTNTSRNPYFAEEFSPGNDAERRRASCLVVARAQLAKEQRA